MTDPGREDHGGTPDRPDKPEERDRVDTGVTIDEPEELDLTGQEITTSPGMGGGVRRDPDRAG